MQRVLVQALAAGALTATSIVSGAVAADTKAVTSQQSVGGLSAPLLIIPPPAGGQAPSIAVPPGAIAPPAAIVPPSTIVPPPPAAATAAPPTSAKPAVSAPAPAQSAVPQGKPVPVQPKAPGTAASAAVQAPAGTGKGLNTGTPAPDALQAGKDLRLVDEAARNSNIDSLMGLRAAPQLGGAAAGMPGADLQNPGARLGGGDGTVNLQPGGGAVDSALDTAPTRRSSSGIGSAAAYGTTPGVTGERLNTGEIRTTVVIPGQTPGVVNVHASYVSPTGEIRNVIGITFRQGGVYVTQGTEINPQNTAAPVQPVTIVTNVATGNSVVIRGVTGQVTQESTDDDNEILPNPYGTDGDSGGSGGESSSDDDEIPPNPYTTDQDTESSGGSGGDSGGDSGSSDSGGSGDSAGDSGDSGSSDSGDGDTGGDSGDDDPEGEQDTASSTGTGAGGCVDPGLEGGCAPDIVGLLPPDMAAWLMSTGEDAQHRKKVKSQLSREQVGQGNPEGSSGGHSSGTGSPFVSARGQVRVWDTTGQPGPMGSDPGTIIWGSKPDVGQAINPNPTP